MSSTPLSPDGAWYWDGRRWVPTRTSPAPLPAFLGRRGGTHWDQGELSVRSARTPFLVGALLLPVSVGGNLASLVLLLLSAGGSGGFTPSLVGFLALMEMGIVILAGCWLYFLCAVIRPPTVRFSARGVLARQPWRGCFYIPWEAVVRIGTHGSVRPLLTVQVSEDFWSYLGRRWLQRWAAPFAFGTPSGRASMVLIPPRGTGMEVADILRCLRQVAPARIPVTHGSHATVG